MLFSPSMKSSVGVRNFRENARPACSQSIKNDADTLVNQFFYDAPEVLLYTGCLVSTYFSLASYSIIFYYVILQCAYAYDYKFF